MRPVPKRPLSSNTRSRRSFGWIAWLVETFSHQRGLHFVVLLAIAVGFFHGWLKLQYRNPLTTFAFDAALSLALVICAMTLPRGERFFPDHPITRGVLSFYIVVALWALVPSDMPLLVRVASLRGWCFPPLIFSLGYHMTRSLEQVKVFFVVLILLGVATGIYGIRQSPDEIRRLMEQDAYFAVRFVGASYATASGKSSIRRFSTFVSPGAFGGVMAFVSSIALVMLADRNTKRLQQILLGGALLIMCYGIILSGSRSPIVSLLLTMGIIVVFRRNFLVPLLVAAAIYLALDWTSEATGGAALERYATLQDRETVGMRFIIPVRQAMQRLEETLLGTGLGSSSYSVPFFLASSLPAGTFRPAEGDLSCLAVEMGIVGILAFGRILWEVCRATYSAVRAAKDGQHSFVGLAVATAVAPTVLSFPVGAPFQGIPTGALTWFFIGCMIKMHLMNIRANIPAKALPADDNAPAKRFLYRRPDNR